jgi:sec-independent protein translocase protein TatA
MHLSPWEIAAICVVIVLLFGVNKIPQLGKGIGEGIRNFKSSLKAGEEEPKKDEKA